MGLNGGRGFHHKAVKGQSAGGHFNGSVNIVRSHLCRLSKQHGAKKKTPWKAAFCKRLLVFSEQLWERQQGLDVFPRQILSSGSKVTMTGDRSEEEREPELIGRWQHSAKREKERNLQLCHHGDSSRYLLPFGRKTATSFSVRRAHVFDSDFI